MAEKLYYLFFNGERICESIRLGDALVLIEAFCKKFYNESFFKFELVELERCNDTTERRDDEQIR